MSSEAQLEALTPLGSSVAGAIVVASIFFVGGIAAIGNYVYTSYPWYDVVIIACFFRTVAYCCRAAYLGGRYRAELEGTFLAFLNAGYGASVAAVCLSLAWWYRNKPGLIFKKATERFMFWGSIAISFLIICFGPIIGVIAAGMIFGAYDDAVLGHRGLRLRFAASYGLVGCNASVTVLLLATAFQAFRKFKAPAKQQKGQPATRKTNPRMIALLIPVSLLFLIRGTAGVTALYETKVYVWENDHFFFPLDTLPELIAFVIFLWPALLARIACCWPKEEKDTKGDEEQPQQVNAEENGDKPRAEDQNGPLEAQDGSKKEEPQREVNGIQHVAVDFPQD